MSPKDRPTGAAAGDQTLPSGTPVNEADVQPDQSPSRSDECEALPVTRQVELIANLPYVAMVLLGSAIFLIGVNVGLWRWLGAGVYLAYGAAGALWVMLFICPYCGFHATRLCPCGYGRIAAALRSRKDGNRFARQFRKHIPVIVPLWFIPLIAGAVFLARGFSWALLILMLAFAVNSFVVLPLVSTRYCCARCSQNSTCPWMARRGAEV